MGRMGQRAAHAVDPAKPEPTGLPQPQGDQAGTGLDFGSLDFVFLVLFEANWLGY